MTPQANNGASAVAEREDDATRAPLEVELFVCPDCLLVGKLPQGRGSKYAAMCVGPPGADHKQRKMQPRRFREVIEE